MSYARVQNDFVLPTIDELIGMDPPTEMNRRPTTESVQRIPTARAIVESSVRHVPRRPHQAQTVKMRAPSRRPMMWPVFVCGVIAGVFGGLALLKSPARHSSMVERAVQCISQPQR